MNKKFDVIHIEDYGVVIDKEAKFEIPNWYYNSVFESCNFLDEDESAYTHTSGEKKAWWKIVASILRKIDDSIPVIELPNELEQTIDKMFGEIDPFDHEMHYVANMFRKGYKAAQSKYKWTDKDMRKAFKQGHTNGLGDSPFVKFDDFIQTLEKNKIPKRVELEMEYKDDEVTVSNGRINITTVSNQREEVKITSTETNTITAINVFYE